MSKLDPRLVPVEYTVNGVQITLYHIKLPGGGLTDKLNLTRAKEELRLIDEKRT